MKYSKLQYFFWLISGSEISALKECENDYNRHANIGLMIFITSLFAFFTSFIAGITFIHNNILGVILFALVWATLIFSIDRSMVNSIKRDPKAVIQPFWSFFIPRLILAFILAFFMSIPLDHIVFPEAIDRQMKINIHNDWMKRQSELTKGYDVSGQDSNLKKIEKEISGLEKDLSSDCPLSTYTDAMNEYKGECQAADVLKKEYENKKNIASQYYVRLPIDRETNQRIINTYYRQLVKARSNAYASWQNKLKDAVDSKKDAKKIDSDWRTQKQAKLDVKDSIRTKSDVQLNADKDSIKENATNFKKDLEDMTGFDTKFTTLFLMPNWGVQVLKWAIFLALLIIEILPTYLKLKTPVGQYDKKMQEREDIMTNDIEHRISSENDITRQTEEHRINQEITLNNSIVTQIAAIELRLAEETLEEWEKKTKEQMKKNVDDATNQNNI